MLGPAAVAAPKTAPSPDALVIYTRANCVLCGMMASFVDSFCQARGLSWHEVDVDQDPDLKARYDRDVPVLCYQGRELCRHEVDLTLLDTLFG